MLVSNNQISPGNFVKFNFWSSYLAPSSIVNDKGIIEWYEIFPGDRGMVISVDANNEIVTVIFSRIEKILNIHINQLKVEQ